MKTFWKVAIVIYILIALILVRLAPGQEKPPQIVNGVMQPAGATQTFTPAQEKPPEKPAIVQVSPQVQLVLENLELKYSLTVANEKNRLHLGDEYQWSYEQKVFVLVKSEKPKEPEKK
jgi:hypothetical protein